MDAYHKGDRVQITGEGRTANWRWSTTGTVEGVMGGRVYVRWDNTHFCFSDEMTPNEIKKVQDVS